MKTEAEFVAKRLEAHAAGTQDVARDPLVQAALADRAAAQEVLARWKNLRAQPVLPVTPAHMIVPCGRVVRRQAD